MFGIDVQEGVPDSVNNVKGNVDPEDVEDIEFLSIHQY